MEVLNPDALNLGISIVVILFVTAFIAGYIDTLVGGGGLITIPALMLAGVPPIFALGTNKLQATAGSATATITLLARRKLHLAPIKWLMVSAFVGSLLGSTLVQFFDASVLDVVIPLVIVLIAVYFILAPTQNIASDKARISKRNFGLSAVPTIGFYDGMFGPATGSFFVLAGVSLQGQGIVDATVQAKALNFATNLAALLVFVFYGKVLWLVGGLMMLGQFLGASFGARALLRIDPRFLRVLVITVSFVMLVAWLMKNVF